MMRYFRLTTILLVLVFAAGPFLSPNNARAATAAEINRDVKNALEKLYTKSSSPRTMGEKAKGILVVDIGAASSTTTTTAQAEIYAFFFDQKGLMAGLGLQGTKITKIRK